METAAKNQILNISFKNGRLLLSNKILAKHYLKTLAIEFKEHPSFIACCAFYYRKLFTFLIKQQLPFIDEARFYKTINLNAARYDLYKYQKKAINKWMETKFGIIVLPTGAGKTILAMSILPVLQRSALILVPTIDLTKQWQSKLTQHFKVEVGLLGGGIKDILDITVSTYDSAAIFSSQIGNKFGVLIFDEVHHASAFRNFWTAKKFIAPYRLGLTATLSDDPERIQRLNQITGPKIFDIELSNLKGRYLANYDLIRIEVLLTEQEKIDYLKHRSIYRDFRSRIIYNKPNLSWARFAMIAYSSLEGKSAMASFLLQKKIAFSAQNKFIEMSKILNQHQNQKLLVFTNDNETALQISQQFNLALITHKTNKKMRAKILSDLKEGNINHIVSSKVLNEGIDVPDISVGVIFSGSSTVREQMQRLGRILRKVGDKKAVLYEILAKDTFEVFVSDKRNVMLDDGLL